MRKILVVDDDQVVRDFVRYVLHQAGYLVQSVPNGDVASKVLEQGLPDLILTDMWMPKKAGNQLIEEVRSHYPTIPIIAMSGAATAQPGIYLKMARSLGADFTLDKPFSPDDLLRRVELALYGSV